METVGHTVNCYIDNKKVLSFTKGVRVITDMKGQLLGVVGIETDQKQVRIDFEGKAYAELVDPNVTLEFSGKLRIVKKIPFFQPY
jgi:hypothetical protein